ncbi:hypothetical protein ISG27_12900 [Burkholderia pseudomallei]|nr:hypothetical protein [Burkholderia pseudomallei]MBF3975069.1 hypothetical protein [Burkholderia pseudomallei]
MQNLKVRPDANMGEGRAMELMFDGFRKATRTGNDAVIVRYDGVPFIFKRAPLSSGVDSCTLHDSEGAVMAVCHMDKFDE